MENQRSLRARLMQAVSDLIYRHHWPILIVSVIITAAAATTWTKLELKLNFTDMLSDTEPAVIQYKHAVEQFGALSYLFVVVDAPTLERSKQYADALAARLPRNPDYVPRVFYKIDFSDYLDYGLLYLEPKELKLLADLTEHNRDAIARMAADPSLAGMIEGVNQVLGSYVSGGELPEASEEDADYTMVFDTLRDLVKRAGDYAVKGPSESEADLKSALTARFLKGKKDLPVDPSESYLVGKDKKHLLMLVSSTKPAEDFEWCRQFMEYVEGEIKALEPRFPDVPKPGLTGNAAIMRDDNDIIREDMTYTTILAFVAIMLLFAFSFRNLSSILMVGVPLAAGILWAVGAAYLMVGHLTPVTAIFGAILLGLGVDYAILILSRYTEERHAGRTIKESLDVAMVQTGSGILAGAAATSLAFFSMTRAELKAGQEMGLIAGCGIIVFVLIMTFGLGSLLVAWDKHRESVGPTQRRFNPLIMRAIAGAVDHRSHLLLPILTVVVVILAIIAPRFQFEYNYLNLEPKGIPSIELVHKIPEWFGIDTNYGMVISKSIDQDRKYAKELRAKPTISRVDAISDFIPEDQPEKLEIIHRIDHALSGIQAGGTDLAPGAQAPPLSEEEFERLLAALKALRDTIGAPGRGLVGLFYLAELGEAEDGARALLKDLDDLIARLEQGDRPTVLANLGRLDGRVSSEFRDLWGKVDKMTKVKEVTPESLGRDHPELTDRFQGRDGSFVVYAYPSVVIWEEQNLKAVAREMKEVDPHAMGVAILFSRILDVIKSDLRNISLLALAVVFLVILAIYRGLWHTSLTLIPLVAGSIAMVGVMNLTGLKFNIVNVGMLPLIIGISVDYGVYVIHRWIDEGKGVNSIRPVVESTGRAVTLSALTTMIGFASIIPARWRGLSLMGGTLAMGIGLCWIAAVVYLPSILKVLEQIKERRKNS